MANPYEANMDGRCRWRHPYRRPGWGCLEQGVLDAHFQPTCRAGRSTNLSVDHITETDVTLPNEDWDLIGGAASTQHDLVTNAARLTPLVAGKYCVGVCAVRVNATGVR